MLDFKPTSSRPTPLADIAASVARLRRAAWAFTTRRVPRGAACQILNAGSVPHDGDLLLARVDALGHHKGLQLSNGRRRHLFVGDEIVVAYGNRYASSQFEAVVPETLGPCHLVAGGGVAAKALSWHARIARGPTQITPIGLLADGSDQVVNLRDFALHGSSQLVQHVPTTVAVVGTAMDSGKTQTAAFLVKGLSRAGLRVGYAKITGTGAGGDTWLLKDAGADPVLDFTDAGLVSTYLASNDEIERVLTTLINHVSRAGVDAIVLELADGVLQQETAALLRSRRFHDVTDGIVLAARDSMGAIAGVHWLEKHDVPVIGLSGVLTASPLQCQEAVDTTGLPIYSREELAEPRTAIRLLGVATNDGGVIESG